MINRHFLVTLDRINSDGNAELLVSGSGDFFGEIPLSFLPVPSVEGDEFRVSIGVILDRLAEEGAQVVRSAPGPGRERGRFGNRR